MHNYRKINLTIRTERETAEEITEREEKKLIRGREEEGYEAGNEGRKKGTKRERETGGKERTNTSFTCRVLIARHLVRKLGLYSPIFYFYFFLSDHLKMMKTCIRVSGNMKPISMDH